jgi:hypothetical protein
MTNTTQTQNPNSTDLYNHIKAIKAPFGLQIPSEIQETPEKFWAYGYIYKESAETFQKRCFRPCGKRKKNVVACREGSQVVFSLCKSTGNFTVDSRAGF